MRITWCGTGSAWSRTYGNSSAVVESSGKRILIDCGHTAPARLQDLGLGLRDLDAVFISHLHGDHTYGLEEWGFKSLLLWGIRPTLVISKALVETLWSGVLSGTMGVVTNRQCTLDDYFDVITLSPEAPQTIHGFEMEIHAVRHVPNAPAFGVKVSAAGASAGFTCDSVAGVSPWFYAGTDAVFHDCALHPPFPETVHAHFSELLDYPPEWRRKTWLVHYGDELPELERDHRFVSALDKSGLRITRPNQTLDVADGVITQLARQADQ